MKSYLTIISLFFIFSLSAQTNKIDSLQKLLAGSLVDSHRVRVLTDLGIASRALNAQIAVDYAQKAVDLAEKTGIDRLKSRTYHNLAWDLVYVGKYPEANEKALQALKIKEQEKDKAGTGRALSLLGIIAYNMNDFDKATTFHGRAFSLSEALNDSTSMGHDLGNMGNVFEKQKQLDKALDYYKRQLAIVEKINLLTLLPAAYTNMGNIYARQKNAEKALIFYEKALEINLKMGKNLGLPYTYGNIALALLQLNRFAEAVTSAQKGLDIAQKTDAKRAIKFAFITLSEIYDAQKDYEKSLYYHKKFYALSDSMNGTERQKSVVELQTKYETEKKEQQILFLEKSALQEREISEQKRREERLVFEKEKDKELALAEQERQFELQLLAEKQQKEQIVAAIKQQQELAFLTKQNAQELGFLSREKAQEAAIFTVKDDLRRKQMGVLSVSALVLAGFLGLFFLQNKKVKKANLQLEIQNKTISEQSLQLETMMREIHHRVKNNLQVINSLLNLQARQTNDEKTLNALREGQSRVKSMALIHTKLYQNDSLARIDFQEYTTDLSKSIVATFKTDKNIVLNINANDIKLDIDTAVPLGLILNELITNALKYAYVDIEKGILNVELLRGPENKMYQLKVSDNGCGLPLDFDYKRTNSLGLKLINSLTRQLQGNWEATNLNGAVFTIHFKEAI